MIILRIIVKNFRGIKNLDWSLNSPVVCLVGPGDSTKSTILNAIDLAFTPRWNVTFSDLDFYLTDVTQPIEISVYITQFPPTFIKEDKYGLLIGYWNSIDGIHTIEKAGDLYVLNVKFQVSDTLEPKWTVKSIDTDEERQISAYDRGLFGVSEIGSYFQRDFSWGPVSALTKITGNKNTVSIPSVLAKVSRFAREGMRGENFIELDQAIKLISAAASEFGLKARDEFEPGLDPAGVNFNTGNLTLFDGQVPVKAGGLGSRRILAMAMQFSLLKEGALILVDEVESGLEPYRLRKILRTLKEGISENSQVIMTTHSEIPLVEFSSTDIFIVKCQNGNTEVTQIHPDLQATLRAYPEAFLARSVILCEGKTEWGLCRALGSHWIDGDLLKLPLSLYGVEPVCSPTNGGSNAPTHAKHLSTYGYRVCYFGDSDNKLTPSEADLTQSGVKVVLWGGCSCTEQRISMDLPYEGFREMVFLAIELAGSSESVINLLNANIESQSEWIQDINSSIWGDNHAVRVAFGKAAKSHNWFKKNDNSYKLGLLLSRYLDKMEATPTYNTLVEIQKWAHNQ